jgi:methane/ammonia monooxygenase subunit A
MGYTDSVKDSDNQGHDDARSDMSQESAITTPEQQRRIFRAFDWMLLPVASILLGGIVVFLVALTVGDWDYWQDWRDRRWWPLVTPVSVIVAPAVFTYFFWKYFRLPIAATAIVMGYMIAAWVSRFANFHLFADFPMAFVSPSNFIGMAIILDSVLLLTRSFYLAGFVGAFLFGVVIYPLNWPAAAAFHTPLVWDGYIVTAADLMGFMYIRTAMPEYVRIIEESTLRTFGEAVTPLTAFFAGFVTILNYYLWVWIGSKLAVTRWANKLI